MGEVYRARDPKLQREVAVKVLPKRVDTDPDRVARFRREAQVLASLNHPNIGAIYGFEDVRGSRARSSSWSRVPRWRIQWLMGPLDGPRHLSVARQIAEALEAAHDRAIIHRDLKPANIKLRPDGTVKVLDFGLGKAERAVGAPRGELTLSPTITTPGMTAAGVILGTAAVHEPGAGEGEEPRTSGATSGRSGACSTRC